MRTNVQVYYVFLFLRCFRFKNNILDTFPVSLLRTYTDMNLFSHSGAAFLFSSDVQPANEWADGHPLQHKRKQKAEYVAPIQTPVQSLDKSQGCWLDRIERYKLWGRMEQT